MSEARSGRVQQIKIYTGKCFRMFVNEKGWKSLISTVIIALILAWIIGDHTFEINESTKSGIFAMICGCIWIGLFNSIQLICRERAIIKREHRTGMHISSYLLARLIFEFCQCAAEGLIITIIFALFRDVPQHGVMFGWTSFEFFISFTLVLFAADALGIMVSCIVKTENAAMTVMPFVLIIQLVLSGLMFEIPENATFLKELTVSKWGVSAICSSADVNELPTRDTIQKMKDAAASDESIHSWKDLGLTQTYEMEYEATPQHVLSCWLVLLLFAAVFVAIGYVFLRRVDKDKR